MKSPFNIILVRFMGNSIKDYSYFCDLPVKKGDEVIIFANCEYKAVTVHKVKGLSRAQRDKATTLVICKLDMDDYLVRDKRLEAYHVAKETLQNLKEQFDEFQFYETIAKDNPEMQEALDAYKALCPPTQAVIESGKEE